MDYSPSTTLPTILCCECGIPMPPNTANTCLSCLRSRVDITEGLPRMLTVSFCRGCSRFHQPPTQWLPVALESKELLALLLRKMKGLGRVRLVDAKFLWTEPHSRRIKMVLQVQKEVLQGTVLQQSLEVETVMAGMQCPDCTRLEAKNTWQSVCQLRQKVPHKRTFLYLEQVILKHSAHKDCVSIKGRPDGLDFFFSCKQHALKFISFLEQFVPLKFKQSEQLISTDVHSGSPSYKFTFSVEIVPICKDDLVVVSSRMAQQLGSISPLLLCSRVTTACHFIDPNTCQRAELQSSPFWNDPFVSLLNQKQLIEYYVVDVEKSHDHKQGKAQLCDVHVSRMNKAGELSSSILITRSHLGGILKPGDIALGYDLTSLNVGSDELDTLLASTQLPDLFLVKKSYRHLRKSRRSRNWALKNLDMEVDQDNENDEGRDVEDFMDDLEEDKELRDNINIYRSNVMRIATESDAELADVPKIPLEELLEDLCLE